MPVRLLLTILTLATSGAAAAAMVETPLEYTVGDATMRSVLVYDDAVKAPRPGLLMVPNWRGATDIAVAKAREIAGRDYVVLVADVFGKDVRPADDAASRKVVHALYGDLTTLRNRADAAYDQLVAQIGKAPIDEDRIGAFGFCFGGGTVLELARTGVDLDAVVTFHGNLESPRPVQPGQPFKPAVLVLNGADDQNVKPEEIKAFEIEMNAIGADWQFHNFAGAVHCFAEPEAQNPPGCVYDKRAADRAFRQMRAFLDERFGAAR